SAPRGSAAMSWSAAARARAPRSRLHCPPSWRSPSAGRPVASGCLTSCKGAGSMNDRKIRVLVVDDHPVLRDGVAAALQNQTDMVMVGEARNGEEAVERFRALRPDVT